MYIANIITTDKINIGEEFNIRSTISDLSEEDLKLPTLIVGYEVICDLYGAENVDLLDRQITSKIFWTLRKNEKRIIYSNDLETFIRYSYKKFASKLNFINLDLILYSKRKLFKIVKKILTIRDGVAYESSNKIIYLYHDNLIFIIDLNLTSYLGLNSDKIINKVKSICKKYISGNDILIEYGNHLDRLENDVKLIPFLYSLNPSEE